ncbi:MAG: phosphate ABC transporter permease subunit PstC [Methanocella sp.]
MRTGEKTIETILLACALSSVLVILLIFIFIISNGLPILTGQGPISFIFGPSWKPDFNIYGIFPLIAGSVAITIMSLVLALPLGLGCAILIAEVAPLWVRDILRPAIDTLAGIPSILYGLFGLVIIVPLIMNNLGGPGQSVLACGIVLAVMVLPTIVSISEDSMRAVPRELREGSLAMGATKWQMISGIVVPSAMSGIVASIVLAMGRAIGETMAVIMVCGGVGLVPTSLLDPVYPLTAVIASEWGYSSGLHQTALFAIGIVLLIIIMIFNVVILFAKRYGISANKV